MIVDMTKMKVKEEPKVEEQPAQEVPKEQLFNVSLTKEELEVIINALRGSKNFETFAAFVEGQKENAILLDLEKFE